MNEVIYSMSPFLHPRGSSWHRRSFRKKEEEEGIFIFLIALYI